MSARFSEANGPSLTPPSRVVKTTSYGPGALSQRIQLTRDSFANRSRVAAGARAERLRELLPRVDRELAIRVAEVVLDRLRAEEERRRGLPRRPSLGEQERDLELLRRQLVERARLPAPGRLAGRGQLRPRELRPRRGTEVVEDADRPPEALARVATPTGAPEASAVGELGARGLEHVR